MSGIVLPAEYALVGASIVVTGYLTFWQGLKASRARKAAGVKYPQMYAEKAEAEASAAARVFNCTQRAHQNTLESLPNILFSTAFLGLFYPRVASVACTIWTVGRVMYTTGYSTGEPNNRRFGFAVSSAAQLVLLFGSTYAAFNAVKALL